MAPDAMGGQRWQMDQVIISRSHFSSAVGGWQANLSRWSGQMGGAQAEPLVGPITDEWQAVALNGTFTGRDGVAQKGMSSWSLIDTGMMVQQKAQLFEGDRSGGSCRSTDFRVRWQQVVFADQSRN